MTQKTFKTMILLAIAVCMFLFVSCNDDPANEKNDTEPNSVQTTADDTSVNADTSSSDTTASDTSAGQNSDVIKKVTGGADETGIYSVVIRLTDKAADKGVVELVYYGAKGSPQENSVVNTFRIEYYKEDAGTYEIQTFFNGEIYQDQHHKDEVKVTNTFGAELRAGSVIISYAPDGEEAREIFRADADYFRG